MSDPSVNGIGDLLFIVIVLVAAGFGLYEWIRRRSRRDDEKPPDRAPDPSTTKTVATPKAPEATAPLGSVGVPPFPPNRDRPASRPAQPTTPAVEVNVRPVVQTRTTSGVRVNPGEQWPLNERPWTPSEDAVLLRAYDLAVRSHSVSMPSLAVAVGIDQLQVARRLIRFTLAPRGDIEDLTGAVNHGSHYSAATRNALLALHDLGLALPDVAARCGRTQLGAGWQIVERRHPPMSQTTRSRIERGLTGLSDEVLREQLAPTPLSAASPHSAVSPRHSAAPRLPQRDVRLPTERRADVCPECFQIRSVSGSCGCS